MSDKLCPRTEHVWRDELSVNHVNLVRIAKNGAHNESADRPTSHTRPSCTITGGQLCRTGAGFPFEPERSQERSSETVCRVMLRADVVCYVM